ncbi:MAG: hypothetical protein FD123_4110 [Bacteroidetes bacterium]|nr:MAG: hypothetical protein FD123_4110 [Bacteroidota bacterium]
MNAATTYIRRAVLDIGLPEELREKGFEEMFRDALLNDLSGFIEAEIARRNTSGKRISIDTLSIDLGPVKSSGGREEFIGRFKKEFVLALDRSLEFSKEKTNETDLLKFFLENGSYPWWASHASGQDLDSLVRALSPAMYDEFISWLAGSVKNDAVRLRLQGQLSSAMLREIVAAITGPESAELMDAIDALHVLFHPGEDSANKKNAWGARWLLTQLGSGTAFTTDRRAWLEKYIRAETAFSLVTAKDRAGLLPKLAPATRQLSDSLQKDIHEIASRALQENGEVKPESDQRNSAAVFLSSERPADVFSYIARYGSLPQEIQTESREQYFARLSAASRTDRRAFLAVLRELSADTKRLVRLFLQLGRDTSAKLFPILFPGEEEILRFMRQQFALLQQAGLLAAGSAETEALLSAATTYVLLVHAPGKEKELPVIVVRPFIITPAATIAKLKSGSLFENLPEAVKNMVLQKIEAAKKTKETSASPAEEPDPVTDTGSLLSSRYLSDLLDHFLLHKTLPWWAEVFKTRPDIFDASLRKGSTDDMIFSAAHKYFARRFAPAYAVWARAAISHPAMRAAICWDIPQADTEHVAAALLPWRKIHVPSLVRLLLAVTGAEKKQKKHRHRRRKNPIR